MHLTAVRGNAQQQRITTTKQAKAGVQMRERAWARAGMDTCLPAVARALAVPAGCVQASSAGGLSLAEQTGSFWPARSCRADFASPHSTKSNIYGIAAGVCCCALCAAWFMRAVQRVRTLTDSVGVKWSSVRRLSASGLQGAPFLGSTSYSSIRILM